MPDSTKPTVGVGMIGYAFMGAVHSQAWRTVGRVFDLGVAPRMAAICGRNPDNTQAAASKLGWASAETDWRRLIERDDIHLVDICAPGDHHAEIAIAALAAGKHVLCEKPLANTVDEAIAMTRAADQGSAGGVRSMVGFNYRRVPAIALAQQLIQKGRLGTVRHIRAQYLQDWIVDPQYPLVWRLRRERAGSGALGDIGAHLIDLAQFLTGDLLTGVAAITETFVTERPLPQEAAGLAASVGRGASGRVTVDDCALFLGRFAGGAVAAFEATRFAAGRKNSMRIEINGSAGSLSFDFESMNELWFHDHTEDAGTAGFRRILVTEQIHPYLKAWWPPGHLIGYEHSFTHEVADLLSAISNGTDPAPSFADGLQVQRVLAAVEASAGNGSCWTEVPA